MPICTYCHLNKPTSEFHLGRTSGGGRSKWCKDCKSIYDRKRYTQKKDSIYQKVIERRNKVNDFNVEQLVQYLLKNPCKHCGETNPLVLEFHHVRGQKERIISDTIFNRGIRWDSEIVQKELDKCEVLCANCHRIETARQQNSIKWKYLHNKT